MRADPHLLPKDDPDHWLKCDGCGGLYARIVHKIGAVCPSSTCRYNNDGYLQTFERAETKDAQLAELRAQIYQITSRRHTLTRRRSKWK